jgi:hypothetical protein
LSWGADEAPAESARGVRVEMVAPDGLTEAWVPRRVALVVGVDQYADPQVPALQFASRDALDVAEVLAEPALGGFDQVVTLQGQVDRDAFWLAFDDLTASLERDDTFLLYFAGHGTLDWTSPSETALFLLPSDAQLQSIVQTAIPLAEIDTRVASLRTQRRVVVLDTCYSGLGRSTYSPAVAGSVRGMRGRTPIAPRPELTSRYEARLYAADYHEPANEDPALGNGVYTHFLVDGLRSGSADLNGDERVELLEAHWWAQGQTMLHTGSRQNPWMEVTQVGAEWLYLTPDSALPPTGAILYVPLGESSVRGVPAAPTRARVDGSDQGSGRLEPGLHQIEILRANRVLRTFLLEVRPGDRLDIGELAHVPRSSAPQTVESALLSARPEGWLSLGAGLAVPSALAPLPSLSASGWYHPKQRGPRLTLGGSAATGLQPARWWVGDQAVLGHTVHASAGAGLTVGAPLTVSATLEVGALARIVRVREGRSRDQGAPTASAALRLGWPLAGGVGLSADLQLMVLPFEGHLQLAPLGTVGVGALLR